MTLYTGTAGPAELSQITAWDPRTGFSIIRRWRGTPTAIDTAAAALLAAGVRYEIEPAEDGGYAILKATYGAADTQSPTEPLADNWDLDGARLEKPIWELPKVQAELAKIADPKNVGKLRADILALARGEDETTDADGETIPLVTADLLAVATALGCDSTIIQGLITTLAKGVEAFPVSAFVLRHTLTVARNFTAFPAYTGINQVVDTTTLIATENIPVDTLVFDLPTGYWLKGTPTARQRSWDKWDIVQEWEFADTYDTFIYT